LWPDRPPETTQQVIAKELQPAVQQPRTSPRRSRRAPRGPEHQRQRRGASHGTSAQQC